MERGNIKINIEEGKTSSVEMQLVNRNLWLTKNELARFLGCFVQKINAELKNIFKENLLSESDCIFCNRYTDKGIEKQCIYYNLEVLIFLSYRINSFQAKVFREYVSSALHRHLHKIQMPDINLSWLFNSNQNYRWN